MNNDNINFICIEFINIIFSKIEDKNIFNILYLYLEEEKNYNIIKFSIIEIIS